MWLKIKIPFSAVRLTRPAVFSFPICLLLTPLFSLVHEVSVLLIGTALQSLAMARIFKDMLIALGLDPVYASVVNRTVGNIEARGIAVSGPLGSLLNQIAPQLFSPPESVLPGAWVTALVGDGVSLLASSVATIGTEIFFVLFGLALLWGGLRGRRMAVSLVRMVFVLLGIMFQARGVAGLLNVRFSPQELEIMGLSHIFTKLIPLDSGSYAEMVADPTTTAMSSLISLIPVVVIYGGVFAVLLVGKRELRRRLGVAWLHVRMGWPVLLSNAWRPFRPDVARAGTVGSLAVALLLGGVLSQGLFPALANYNYTVASGEVPAVAIEQPPVAVIEKPPVKPLTLEPAPVAAPAVKPGPSRVYVTGGQNKFSFTVNGVLMKLRGVGYNPMYSHLTDSQRAARYNRDFGQMKASGINTVLGWEREQFDELTLEKAQEYGIGVIIPYYLPREGDYGKPEYDSEVEQDVKNWVQRFRRFPALRMWGIGNEVIHGMGRDPDTPKARAFSKFYMRLADTVHELDPDHPVTYRDAEDLYLNPIREILNQNPGSRPWFVYGMNIFTERICQVAADWPQRNMDVAVMFSEFAPSGLTADDRPKAYINMQRCIAKEYPTILGGFAYVWFANGPEAIDRVMGLVDGEGRPVDRSLYLLGKAFRHEAALFDENLFNRLY